MIAILRLLFPWAFHARLYRANSAALVSFLKDDSITKAEIIASPVGNSIVGDPDWELVEWSDEKEFKDSPDPSQCVCGNWWTCITAESVYPNKPNQNDITTLLATIDYPNGATRPACKEPCVSVQVDQNSRWWIYKNKKTGQFGLLVSKRRLWHCEVATGPTTVSTAA